ncbi:protein mono-ADP-ribosyltransferase TIPARP-like [Cheilinus undulatus]|uniref:protein mono-ADP-ribosyltransferase TIPARP-like n=1 Tax=Cheilinus undulatus TaxID=241271 RepID=UPI001BD38C48|nr:protein mono-ADP-ribosyltransferase TIPARP-like [Cheilinus undulatus]
MRLLTRRYIPQQAFLTFLRTRGSKMPYVSSSRGVKRKVEKDALPSETRSSKVTFLSPSLLLLEIPPDTNTSLPVWEAMRSQHADVAWTVNPYSVSVHLTPQTSTQGSSSESKSSETPSSSLVQTQMVIQSVGQQHTASQNNSCVLLTFPQTSTLSGQPQTIPPTQNTSVVISLPVIISQPPPLSQPSTPTKTKTQQAIHTPTTTPTKPKAPSGVPVPSPFHTKSCSDILICDNFLLNLCHAGKKCKMHHTPYPFHWQLWAVSTHQWVDLPAHSQVLIERIYCDVNQESVLLKDGNDCYSLNFDSMELNIVSKYDAVRRLTNSDNPFRNHFFPSKWKIYWWNNFTWEEYEKNLSASLLKSMSEKDPQFSFNIGSMKYQVDFTTMTQTNIATGFKREVRCRPVYRSPDSMQPNLQTGILPEPSSDSLEANFNVDPLEEFSSWYPPVWSLVVGQDYSLVDVPAGSRVYRTVQNLFYESLPESKVDVVKIQQIQNHLHWDKYQRHKAYMQKHHTKQEPLERHLFHGTTKNAAEEICHNNFDPRLAGLNGTSYGFGSYFATTASFSNTFSAKVGPNEVRHMFLAKVLVGKVSIGKNNYRRPPPLNSKTKRYCLYDTCVDNMDEPTMFVVFDSCQCYPYYLIKYKELPREIDINQ